MQRPSRTILAPTQMDLYLGLPPSCLLASYTPRSQSIVVWPLSGVYAFCASVFCLVVGIFGQAYLAYMCHNDRYGKPIHVDKYMPTYLQDPKKAAKQLTADLKDAIEALTVNAPNWESRDAAEMARWLLFPKETGSMRDYVKVTQRYGLSALLCFFFFVFC